MKIKSNKYTSYKTHSYCSKEEKWYTRVEAPGIYCPECNIRLRKNPRNKESKKDKWLKAI